MIRSAIVLLALAGCADPNRLFFHPREEFIGTPHEFAPDFIAVEMPRDDGEVTRAWWVPREGAEAAIVLFSGNTGNRSYFLGWARIAWEAGFSVLMVDYQGFGPDAGKTSLRAFRKDAIAAVDWAATKVSRLGVWGISLGSAPALSVAMARPETVLAVCVEGSYRLKPAMKSYMEHAMPKSIAWALAPLTRSLLLGKDSDPEYTAEHRSPLCPVMFVHGDKDRLTNTVWAAELYERSPGPKEMWFMEGTGHAPEPLRTQDGEFADQVSAFFRRTLLGEGPHQAFARWTAIENGGDWSVHASVSCPGPFPAPVEVLSVADGEVIRRRIWMTGPSAMVDLAAKARPATVTARRYHRVAQAGDSWEQALTDTAISYRALRAIMISGSVASKPLEELLALPILPRTRAQLAFLLYFAALQCADPVPKKALLLRCLEALPQDPRDDWVVGDASFHSSLVDRDTLERHLRLHWAVNHWDSASLDAELERFPRVPR